MSEEHRLDGPSLRLGRRGKLFRHDGKEQRDVAPLARATTPGPSAHAHAHAHAHFNAHAHAHAHFSASTQGAGTAPTGSPALNGDPVPAFGDQVISTWRELRDLVQLRDIAIETTAAAEFEGTLNTAKNEDAGLAKAHNAYVSNIAKQKLSKNVYAYERLPLQPPPGMQETREEVRELHRKQTRLRGDEFRQKEIIRQVAANNPTDMLRRLGIEELAGYRATRALISTVLQLSERVGYVYKTRYTRPRPSHVDNALRPFIGIPPHPSYPSNHAFQDTCVALVLSRAIPEYTATQELFHVAQRIGENREYAGLHYKSDTEAGVELAGKFAPYLFYACRYQMRAVQREWYEGRS
ncbi:MULTISPECIES: phosphatase PAP2 family protein [unclassified Mameliella]|uniref:phosphatase PAP2 family protein n=1 Tax=unclassified Mameliella TaxID=2630630 RepID=UPI00273E7D4A|nr:MULTISPECIES: phosphatase PAP2 family protein [unclassified Mameliella]